MNEPPTVSAPMSDDSRPWKPIEADIDLYKFYLDMALKATVFALGITGGLTSYYLAQEGARQLMIVSLVLPLGMNAAFAYLFGHSVGVARKMAKKHRRHCRSARVEPYNMKPLRSLMAILCGVHVAVTAGLAALIVLELT